MLVRLIIAIISALSCLAAYASTEDKNDMLIDSIEEHIARYSYVRQQKKDLLDSMKSMRAGMPAGEQRIRLGEILGRRYICHNIDSAMLYWRLANREAEDIGDKELSTRLRLNLLAVMPLRGISIEAVREFEKIDPANFSPELKHLYWLNYSELYNNIQKPYPPGMMKNRYREKAALALDSLLAYYPPQSPVAAFIKSYLHLLRDEKNMAAASFLESLPALEQRPELYDHAIANVVDFYRDRPNHKELYLNYLYTRLLRQLRNGDAKPRVLAEAGQNLINQGHDKLGQQLMLLAMHTSEKELGPYSSFDYSEYTPQFTQRYTTIQKWSVAILAVMSIALILLIIRLRRYKARASTLKHIATQEENDHKAVVADMLKVSGNLLSMALFTNEQLKEYNLFVNRKLKAGQVKDLYHDIQSGEYIRSLNDKFFAMFDESFLENFPGFIDRLNQLLAPGRELALLPGGRMTPELRIAAFMRLGINDSAKLAQVLGLSVNTIYTYRNRLKGRALDRQNFEKDIQTIAFSIPQP